MLVNNGELNGTTFRVDPKEDLTAILMVQTLAVQQSRRTESGSAVANLGRVAKNAIYSSPGTPRRASTNASAVVGRAGRAAVSIDAANATVAEGASAPPAPSSRPMR